MDGMMSGEDTVFAVDEITTICKDVVEAQLKAFTYAHSKVTTWTSNVIEESLKKLTALNKPFKYVVSCIIMQKNGAGLHTACSCFWDLGTDGCTTVRWENRSMYCVLTVFGMAL
ncbi:Dynein light chain Tctex-1 like protein [Aduncisulcus paluster]|uniref:Dynein light chain Tctex-1 like protein n=1 Tax=Aduncisulcus paluster TaxID=2918883 RepID=A0ABQ5KWQ4_9EUKA|nr:Dynein light chain Tctex-1 like protein [Aduncisulcus paluster]